MIRVLFCCLALTLGAFGCDTEMNDLKTVELQVDHHKKPLGLDTPRPQLSWQLASKEEGKKQSAYRILAGYTKVALDDESNALWDSGKVISSQTLAPYEGPTLSARDQLYWKVMIWDENDQPTEWSPVASWSMGLLNSTDWTADWLSFPLPDEDTKDTLNLPPPAYFRKSFVSEDQVTTATLYVTALGLYDVTVNGQAVTENRFTPGWTDYTRRINYQTYDVTSLLTRDENVIGAILADGWYAGYVGPKELSNPHNRELYGKIPALRCQLELTYANGERKIIGTDTTWRASSGPIRYADLLMGEVYDARLENSGWNQVGYAADQWQQPVAQPQVAEMKNGAVLEAYPGNPIQPYAEIATVEITEPTPGTYIFDLGQNFAGHARLSIQGDRGDAITLRFGEMLNGDGSLMTENLRFARATDRYILKGGSLETWEPRFTYHGFRYVEVQGLSGKPDLGMITGIAQSASTPMISTFHSSDSLLNQLYRNIRWTQRSNFLEVPTDSPQRDERLGWLGDAQIFSRSALYNADLSAFYKKWFADVRDAQYDFGAYANFAPRPYPKLVWYSPGWMEAGVMVPYNAWQFSGDTSLIGDHYESMTRYMDFVIEKSQGLSGFYPENSWTEIGPKGGFGDWLALTEKHLAHDLTASLYLIHSLRIMAEMSTALGHSSAATRYQELHGKSVQAFVGHYVTEDGSFSIDESAYGDGKGYFEGEKGFTGHTQSAYATAIYFEALPDSLMKLAAGHLVDLVESANHKPTSGILGIRQLLPALAKIGRSDLAYKMLLDKGYPSWGFQIVNGATTIWERWNSYTIDKGFNGAMNSKMNSFNHYAFGAAGQFLFSEMAGMQPAKPGFSEIIIKPMIGDHSVKNVSAEYLSIHGKIASAWEIDGDKFVLDVEIPANTKARIYVTIRDGAQVNGQSLGSGNTVLKEISREDGYAVFAVHSGRFQFVSEL